MRRFLLALCMILAGSFALAVEPDEILSDPVLEERARAISANVRCVVCQNEPIDSSNAGVARDLRLLIRERLVAGDTDQQVYDFLVARYGEYVLFKPPFSARTFLMWLAPFFILGGGGIAVWDYLRRRRGATLPEGLSDEEQARVDALLKDDEADR